MTRYPEHYQNGGPSVDFYDVREGGGPGTVLDGDVEFYLAQVRKVGGPVLDVACGTGRVAFPIARAGVEVTGIDRAPGMIALARAKQRESGLRRLHFVRADMTRFQLPRKRFRLAIVAYRAFQHLLTPKAQRACLTRLHRHLARNGRLIVHLFDPRLEFCTPSSPVFLGKRPTVHDAASGCDVALEVTDRTADPVTQTFSEIWRWRVSRGGAVVQTYDELRLRWTYRYEMRYLLELTGFKVIGEHSDFKGSPPRYGAELVFTCVRL